ncbi:MFS transporter [Luteolibacter flavescens]|uniref:MFS transporter n=1 Tax=Luteolibacter flavescens TaxID=1859460 RepID=A0ABT3FW30_9BACT|nr:MFS transporter [Luteolibacter flavescens]MCW1887787.1 MFS transporter [Luteolibacter flavescens]
MDDAPEVEKEPTRREWAGYWCAMVQQTQNAFNDKAAQFLLIPLGGWLAGKASVVDQIAGLMITLPYILFAPLAGWLSDRFPKRTVMIGSAVAQALILAGLCAAILMKNLPLAMVGFFALATQSAFISPAKIGIIKELVGSRNLGFASGIQQMTAMLAILTGQIAAGIIFSNRLEASGDGWQSALGPLLVITALSVPAILLSLGISRTPRGIAEPLTPSLAIRHVHQLGDLWRDPVIRRTSWGVAFFWAFAGFINLWSIGVAKELTGGGVEFGRVSSKFMAAASLGMAGGFGFASLLLKRRIELGWVPLAGIAMTISSLVLALVPFSGDAFLIMLAVTAFFAAIFLTPLNAYLQDRCPAGRRGEILAAANLQDCLAGAIVVTIMLGFSFARQWLGDPWWLGLHIQLLLAAVACGAITIFIVRLIPAELVRVVGLAIIRTIYRIRSTGTFPEKGGVLLLPNHITWADAFFLTAACPRPVRFVMEAGFTGNTAVRIFSQLFDTVPISSAKPREALRASADALKAGHVVCIFPEGQLTRTGTLQELKRGFEIIARQANCPLVPTWTDGAWGSIFSFEGNRFFTKFPRRLRRDISVAFAPALDPATADVDAIRHGMQEASAMALASRADGESPAHANALQLAHVNALQRGADYGVIEGDPLPASLPALSIFEEKFGAIRRVAFYPDPSSESHWLGGDSLREKIEASQILSGGVFFDFSDRADEPLAHSAWQHCPCLAIGGVIVAMSMPDPPKAYPGSKEQKGSKPGSRGILLPGFHLDGDTLRGPAIPDGLPLPEGFVVDEEGFVFLKRSTAEETV